MKRKLLSVLSAALTATFLLGGCGASGENAASTTAASEQAAETQAAASEGAAKQARVAFICKDNTDTFCISVQDEFKKASAAYADKFTVDYFDSANTISTQIDQIETCTAAGYDAIVFQQVDAKAPVEAVKKALDAGIKVIVTTGHIEDDDASWYVDADPYQQGKVIAEYAKEQGALDKAKVAILSGPVGNFHSENRVAAFNDTLQAVGSATLVATEVAEWFKDKAMTATQNMLVANPDLKVILAANDDMGLGAVEAIEMAGKQDQLRVYAIDGTAGGLQAVKEGRLGGTVMQDNVGYAVEAINILNKLLAGEEAKSLQIDSFLITSENVDEYLK